MSNQKRYQSTPQSTSLAIPVASGSSDYSNYLSPMPYHPSGLIERALSEIKKINSADEESLQDNVFSEIQKMHISQVYLRNEKQRSFIDKWADTSSVIEPIISSVREIIDDVESIGKAQIQLHPGTRVTEPFELLQQWEGCVLSISRDTFTASLYDLTNTRGVADEEAEFSIEDVSDSDLHLLREGAIFRWLIGYRKRPSGKVSESKLVFRRMPVWRREDLDRARAEAISISESIQWR